MKTLSVRQKAARYDEAIEVIRKCETDKYGCVIGVKPSDLFPELVESEDELTWLKRFIKEEIDCLRYDIRDYKDSAKLDNLQRALAWVEKQGEYINFRNTAKVGDRITKSEEGVLVNLSQFQRVVKKDEKQELEDNLNKALEKETPESWNKFLDGQGEQKPADKVEPKFKVGDWVVSDDKDVHDDYRVCKITKIVDGRYYIEGGDFLSESSLALYEYRLWTIQDAKDGDVVVDKSDGTIGIFQSIGSHPDGGCYNDPSYCFLHCHCEDEFFYADFENGNEIDSDDLVIATKEQRDLLFKKMKEAGYEWDADKKELKEIDNEEVNGEDYGIDSLWHAQRILEKTLGSVDGYQTDDGILEHKCAISAVKKLYKQKPAWSEEDEATLDTLIANYEFLCKKYRDEEHDFFARMDLVKDDLEMFSWLKSIKERVRVQPQNKWKPSDKQMKAIEHICDGCFNVDLDILDSIYKDFKKLREE